MKHPTREEQKQVLLKWDETGPILERIRLEALRGKPYDWKEDEALLDLGLQAGLPPRTTSGLVELQPLRRKWFEKHPAR